MVCFRYKELLGNAGKRLTSEEGSFSVQGIALPSHLRKLVFSANTNIPPSTSPNHPIMGIWLGEPGTGITVGGPNEKGTLAVAFETRKHTSRGFPGQI